MGCDIHSYIEVVHKSEDREKPYVECFGRVRIGRDYHLFSLMAGVRGEPTDALFQPRGMPNLNEVSWEVRWDYCLNVKADGEEEDDSDGDSHSCTRENAESWVKSGSSEWVDEAKTAVTDPDAHTPSYLTLEELEEVQRAYIKAASKHTYSEVFALEQKIQDRPDLKPLYEKSIQYLRIEPHRNLEAVIGAMRGLRTYGAEPRLVFWFDN